MVLGDGEADLFVDLEPAILVHEDNIRWFEGVLVRQEDLSMVESFMKLGVGGPLDGEVPRINVVIEWSSVEVGGWILF